MIIITAVLSNYMRFHTQFTSNYPLCRMRIAISFRFHNANPVGIMDILSYINFSGVIRTIHMFQILKFIFLNVHKQLNLWYIMNSNHSIFKILWPEYVLIALFKYCWRASTAIYVITQSHYSKALIFWLHVSNRYMLRNLQGNDIITGRISAVQAPMGYCVGRTSVGV